MDNLEEQYEDSLGEDSKRILAEITTIKEVCPIVNADRIKLARFSTNFWECVISCDEFKVGDKAVFFEIDSFLKPDERYDAILSKCLKTMKGESGYRIRSQTFRSQLSQGFCMPLSKFPELDQNAADGTDVTELLGVKLYQKPVTRQSGYLMGKSKGDFPSHLVPKTDQIRIQAFKTEEVVNLFNMVWEVSEKAHGTSCTMLCTTLLTIGGYIPDYGFDVCSRNNIIKESGLETVTFKRRLEEGEEQREDDIIDPEHQTIWRTETKQQKVNSVYWDMANKYAIKERLTKYCQENSRRLAIQGEICGPGIQSNTLKLPDVQFFVFDVYDIDSKQYFSSSDRLALLEELNKYEPDMPKIQHVPVLGYDTICPTYSHIKDAIYEIESKRAECKYKDADDKVKWWAAFLGAIVTNVVKDLLVMADGKTFTNSGPREGIVLKSVSNPNKSFKCINNRFLLSEKD